MKKLIIFVVSLIAFTIFVVVVTTDTKEKFYFLNWGEYVNPELLSQFEEEYNVSVVIEEVSSSEDMYQKIKTGTTSYDVAIPGDYIIEKMHEENLINKLDYQKLTNYSEGLIHPDLENLIKNDFFLNATDYTIPYFWGAYSLIYNNSNPVLESEIKENGFQMLFHSELTSKYKVGMYDVPRWAVTSYLLENNIDINTVDLSLYKDDIIKSMKNANYAVWGDDNLKKSVANGNLDYALVQLGDFFDQYYVTTSSNEEVNFNVYIPDNTAAFFDGMVIPKTSKNVDLAHDFINFFLDEYNYKDNALYVGYSPTNTKAIEMIKNDVDYIEFNQKYEFYLDPLKNKTAKLFRNLGDEYQTELENIINEVKR